MSPPPSRDRRSDPNQPALSSSPRDLTWRSFLIGLGLTVFFCWWTPYSELVVLGVVGVSMSVSFPPVGGLLALLLLVLANAPLRRWLPRWALSGGELVVIFSMTLVASVIGSMELAQKMVPILAGTHYFATPGNKWAEVCFPYLPKNLIVSDPAAVRQLFEGSPGGEVPWGAWVRPVAWWIGFALIFYTIMVSLTSLLVRRWMEDEHVQFPLVAPVAELTPPAGQGAFPALFRSGLFWAGVAAGALPYLYNGLCVYVEGLPKARLFFDGEYLDLRNTEWPWPVLGRIFIGLKPLSIGISYLLSVQISFSVWAFHWIGQFEELISAALGLHVIEFKNHWGHFPFAELQGAAAFTGIALLVLWAARRRLIAVAKAALRLRSVDGGRDPMPSALAFWGVVLGFIGRGAWCRANGMSFVMALALLGVAISFHLGMARIVSQTGMPWVGMGLPVHRLFTATLGTKMLSPSSWAGVGMLSIESKTLHWSLVTRLFQLCRLGERSGVRLRRLTVAVSVAIVVALVGTVAGVLKISYAYGGLNLNAGWPRYAWHSKLPGWILAEAMQTPHDLNLWPLLAMAAGIAKVALLAFLQSRFVWWPLHPTGFAVSSTTMVPYEWSSFFVGWLFKGLMLKYGGPKRALMLRPFFLGLILGPLLMAGAWLLIDTFTGVQGNQVLFLTSG